MNLDLDSIDFFPRSNFFVLILIVTVIVIVIVPLIVSNFVVII